MERVSGTEGAAQGGDGASIPGGVPETTGRGTQCSALVGKVMVSQGLDSTVLEVFSKLNGSGILGPGSHWGDRV